MTGDNLTNYQWDAEGRLQSVNNGAFRSYVYNALGREVEWHGDGRVSEDLTDLGGHYLGSVDPSSGAWTGERIPGGKIYLAWYVNGGTTFFHYNALGSSMMNTHQDGNTVSNDVLFYPWGQLWASPVNDYFQFFGNIEGWDWEEGKGVTPNRYYPNYQGRWLSPDPLAGDISNPQSLNRYAYVLNNPTSLVDPTGLGPCDMYSYGQGKGHCTIGTIGPSIAEDLGGSVVGGGWSDPLYLVELASEITKIGLAIPVNAEGGIILNPYGSQGIFFPIYGNLGMVGYAFWLEMGQRVGNNGTTKLGGPLPGGGQDITDTQSCEANVLAEEGASSLVANFSAYSYLPDSPNAAKAWTGAGESLFIKGLALLGARLIPLQMVKLAGAYLAERAVPIAGTVVGGIATTIDAHARIQCGQEL